MLSFVALDTCFFYAERAVCSVRTGRGGEGSSMLSHARARVFCPRTGTDAGTSTGRAITALAYRQTDAGDRIIVNPH